MPVFGASSVYAIDEQFKTMQVPMILGVVHKIADSGFSSGRCHGAWLTRRDIPSLPAAE